MNDSVREFAFELYGKVKQLNTGGRMGRHTRPSQPSGLTRAELEKKSREYRLVMSDDEEEDKKEGGVGWRKGKEEIKFLKDKEAARKKERKGRRRNRKRDKEGESDEDTTVVVHRKLKKEEELVEDTEDAKKEVLETKHNPFFKDDIVLCQFSMVLMTFTIPEGKNPRLGGKGCLG